MKKINDDVELYFVHTLTDVYAVCSTLETARAVRKKLQQRYPKELFITGSLPWNDPHEYLDIKRQCPAFI